MINATKKGYNISNDGFVENNLGAAPGLEWINENGSYMRVIATDIALPLLTRHYKVACIVQTKVENEWLDKPRDSFFLNVDSLTYRNELGQIVEEPFENDTDKPIWQDNFITGIKDLVGFEQKLKPDLITNVDFFLIMVGYNLPNLPFKLFGFIQSSIADRLNLNLIP